MPLIILGILAWILVIYIVCRAVFGIDLVEKFMDLSAKDSRHALEIRDGLYLMRNYLDQKKSQLNPLNQKVNIKPLDAEHVKSAIQHKSALAYFGMRERKSLILLLNDLMSLKELNLENAVYEEIENRINHHLKVIDSVIEAI